MMTIEGHTVRVAHWPAPAGGGLPLFFFNGIGANIELMAPLADHLPDREILTFDMPGIGGSPAPAFPYRPWMMARVAAAILDEHGHKQTDVMGVSWGGAMAQQFALQYGSRIGRLILVATTAGMLMIPGKVASLSKMFDPKRYSDPDYMLRNFETLYGGASNAGAAAHALRTKPPTRMGYMMQMVAMLGWTSAPCLPFMRTDTLILMGDADNIVPVINGRFLKLLIPHARLEIIEGGGHLFLLSMAETVVPIIEEFLSGDEPLRQAA
ncbi:alpha/beta fold hydrolase [Sandaracinobacteroides saxicola]|uniref:Alpha/beta fold hydrolase n=2 Tax=Sandaracinobacteroides saxicola TaxID=2759707 RepID=A0A7G5IMS3_9SPHN|nr:alpha/beta fold hydrolase [Sandaracinobacteroides saxicola]